MAQVPSKGTLQLMEFRVHRLWKANDPGTKACTTILGHLYVNSGGFIAILREDLFDLRFLRRSTLFAIVERVWRGQGRIYRYV